MLQRQQSISGTSSRVPGHGHHACAARWFVARERASRYPREHRRAALSPRLHAKGAGPRYDPCSSRHGAGMVNLGKLGEMSKFVQV